MKRILLGGGTIVGLVAILSGALPAGAVPVVAVDTSGVPLKDGDVISAMQSAGDPDLYIIKFKAHSTTEGDFNGYKRLFLNPAIFSFYGHLGGWSHVKQVTTAVRDSFETSGLFRNCETDARAVYATEVTGEDDGILHHVEMTGDQAVAEDPNFFNRVFCINSREEAFYARSITAYRRLADVPVYSRRACIPPPACLYQNPACLIAPVPGTVWCPIPTPPPGCYWQQVQCIQAPCNPVLVCPTPSVTPVPSGPIISSLQPASGPIGTTVTLSGSGFVPTYNYVQFGGGEIGVRPATSNGTVITFVIPESMGGACSGGGTNGMRACPMNLMYPTPGTHKVRVQSVYTDGSVRTSNEVQFTLTTAQGCYVGGCSGQTCSDQPGGTATTCEYRAEYACYQRYGTCARQSDGRCGWTQTTQLTSCLQNPSY